MAELKEIAIVGGTGAQGIPVVEALASSGRYRLRVLTRNLESSRANQLADLPNVTLVQGAQDDMADMHKLFKGAYGAWVNTDGFTLGEKDELFYGFRAYEIARSEGLQHYVWANIEYVLEHGKFDERYYCGHMASKGRVAKFILALGQDDMKSTIFSTAAYMDMLHGGMFVPSEQPDGSMLWANPAPTDTKIPLIALCDVGIYNLWIFDNPTESAGLDVSVATDSVSFADIARIFTEVTGTPAVHKTLTWEEYAPYAEPYPGASVNWALGPDAPRDKSVMSWADNFRAWWRYWGDGVTPPRDEALLDRIHPKRLKSLADWMKHVGYTGKRQNVLKMTEDWASKGGALPPKTLSTVDDGHSNPSGSSTGSAVAVSAGYAALSIGTETDGSLVSPASRAALYTIKPSIGRVSQSGIIPISHTMDSAGPMAKTPYDLAALLDIISGTDEFATLRGSWDELSIATIDFKKWWPGEDYLKPVEIATKQMHTEIQAAYDKMEELAKKYVSDVPLPPPSECFMLDGKDSEGVIMMADFKHDLNKYLESAEDSKIHSLKDLIEFNKAHPDLEMPPGYEDQGLLIDAEESDVSPEDYEKNLSHLRKVTRDDGLDRIFKEYGVDVIVGSSDTAITAYASGSGYPVGNVPLGYLDFNGRPFGLAVLAAKNQEAKIVKFMNVWEDTFGPRKAPPLLQ